MWKLIIDKPPQFFPLDSQTGQYTITKECPPQGWKDFPVQNRETYCLNYSGEGVVLTEKYSNTNFFSVTIGKSAVDLSQFENKQVKNIKGEFVEASMQCVQNVCKDIGGRFVVLDIDAVELSN